MRVRLGDVRRTIREEFMRGVPEWALRQAVKEYVERIRQHVKTFVLANKSITSVGQREAIAVGNDVLDELEEETYDLLEDKLFQFVRRV